MISPRRAESAILSVTCATSVVPQVTSIRGLLKILEVRTQAHSNV